MPAPRLSATAIVADDPLLLAEITTLIAKRTAYLPLFAGPRLQRPDADNEVARIRNAIARVKPTNLICAGLPEATCAMFDELPWGPVHRVNWADEVVALGLAKRGLKHEPLRWGRSHIGLGTLRALREHRRIVFDDIESPRTGVDMEAAHIVVCEDGDLHSQVLAAAYAMSIDAGLCVFPEFPRDDADAVLEALYVLSERPAPADRFEDLRAELQAHIGELDVRRKALTFITEKIPWGLVFQDLATTHLFRYPYLGIGIVNGIAAEQETAPGVRSAVVIAPHSVESADAATALAGLTRMRVMSKGLRGRIATVHQAAKTITLYPYDLLLIAAHCNDMRQRANDEVAAVITSDGVPSSLSRWHDADAKSARPFKMVRVDLDCRRHPTVRVCMPDEQISLPQARNAPRKIRPRFRPSKSGRDAVDVSFWLGWLATNSSEQPRFFGQFFLRGRRSPDNRREAPAFRADGTPLPGAPGALDCRRSR